MNGIRACTPDDLSTIFEVINDSACAYKDVIPNDAWHEPYMTLNDLQSEVRNGVGFFAYEESGRILAVMGIQHVKDVTLIRHAYVRTECRATGIGRRLLEHMDRLTSRPILIGAWKAASWAIRFYQKYGFTLVPEEEKMHLLRIYWTVPETQARESVVLVNTRWLTR